VVAITNDYFVRLLLSAFRHLLCDYTNDYTALQFMPNSLAEKSKETEDDLELQ